MATLIVKFTPLETQTNEVQTHKPGRMKYLRLKVHTSGGRLVYQRDFSAIQMFNRLIRSFVSGLIARNILEHKEQYNSRIIPKCDDHPKFNDELVQKERQQPIEFQNTEGWLAMVYHNEINADEPIKYLTLWICTAPRQNGDCLIYRRDLRLSELGHFKRDIDTALFSHGFINDGEETEHRIYARFDDQANFEKEIVPQVVDTTDIKIAVRPPQIQEKNKKRFDAYGARPSGSPSGRDLKILVTQRCCDELEKFVREQTPDVEVGGVLLGEICEEETTGEPLIEIHAFIPAESTQADIASLRFTHETWQHIDKRRKSEFPNKTTVGWYHTHPFKALDAKSETPRLSIFFSQKDKFIHQTFFKKPWHVAMVLGYQGVEKGFFQWRGKDVGLCSGFYIYDEENRDE